MVQKILGAQRDFSSGEVDVSLKRADDHPLRKTGVRQLSNFRILNSGAVQNRPGRSALFTATNCDRIEEFTLSVGKTYKIAFGVLTTGAAFIRIINGTGAVVATFNNQFNGTPFPWTAATIASVVYCVIGNSIYLTCLGMKPQVITFDGVSIWTISDYAELVFTGQKRTLFYRLSPPGIAIQPSASTGNITVVALAPTGLWTPQHVGTRILFVGRQILITGYIDSQHVNAIVEEPLPGSQGISFSTDPAAVFTIGDEVQGTVTGSVGIVTDVNSVAKTISVQLTSNNTRVIPISSAFGGSTELTIAFSPSDTVVGQAGSLTPTGVGGIDPPQAVTAWDDEVMNTMRGYPSSCFTDQFRLGFCDFPSVPGGISWSAINAPSDLYVGAQPSNAIFEIVPDRVRVFYVVPGPESSEFVFCDRKLYYIKIDATNPLKPGSVGFQVLSSDGCAQVQPRVAQEFMLYVNAGLNSVMGVVAPGAYYRPFNTKNLCEFHSHLFNNIQAIAIPTADGTFNERYAYVLNGDGSIVVGKYNVQDGQVAGTIGWGPWSGAGRVDWVFAWNAEVLFTTTYFGILTICEILDDTQYLDFALSVNNPPAAFSAPGGEGPVWYAAGQSVQLIDQATRSMGTYQIDANGFIIPQNNGGENLASSSLVAGQGWTGIFEPFCPDANPGQAIGQRMFARRISRFAAYVVHSTGFVMGRLFAGPLTPTSPALGALMNSRRFPAWNQGDNPTLPPPLRETREDIRPLGRAYDPRVAIIKDTPGPLQILEATIEATI